MECPPLTSHIDGWVSNYFPTPLLRHFYEHFWASVNEHKKSPRLPYFFIGIYCVDYCLSLHSYSYAVFLTEGKCYCFVNLSKVNLTQSNEQCHYAAVYLTGRASIFNFYITVQSATNFLVKKTLNPCVSHEN